MCKENVLPGSVPPMPYVVLDLEMCNVNRTMARQYLLSGMDLVPDEQGLI